MINHGIRAAYARVIPLTVFGFIIALASAMLLYPANDGKGGGYNFFYDFISALGETKVHGGVDNTVPSLLFNIGLAVSMLALIPYWYFRMNCLKCGFWLRQVAFLCCFYFCVGLIGVSLTPYNLSPDLHNIFIYSSFLAIIPGIIIMVVCVNDNYYPSYYKAGWVIFIVVALCVELVFQIMVTKNMLPSRPVNPILQKINVLVFLLWIFIDVLHYQKNMAKESVAL